MAIDIERARAAAERLADLIRPAVSEVAIAGSIRRGKPQVKDLELVLRLREDLTIPHAEHAVTDLVCKGIDDEKWAWDAANDKRGRRYKRIRINVGGELVGVDLFIAEPSNFGPILAIRTGDADFTSLMVTRGPGGLMPLIYQQKDGFLWRRRTDTEEGMQIAPCRTEEEYFSLLGLPYIAPPARTLTTALALIQDRRMACR